MGSRLRRRRQFVLAEGDVAIEPGWRRHDCAAGGFIAAAHDELLVTSASCGSVSITVIGYIVDGRSPELDTPAIIEQLASALDSAADVFALTAPLGGRWIMIVDTAEATIAFTDPIGFRQLVFTTAGSDLVLASQPALIAEELDLAPWDAAVEGFVAQQVRRDFEFWWPGDATLYENVRQLIPNHYLDLRTRDVHRFWPTGELEDVTDFAEAASRLGALLQGQVSAAARHFELAHAITAGLDSRMILAASKDVAAAVHYYTTVMYEMTDSADDVTISRRLLGRLGQAHHVLHSRNSMDSNFGADFATMAAPSHQCWGEVTNGMLDGYPDGKVTMHGAGGEIGRFFYYQHADHPAEVTLDTLVAKARMPDSPLVRATLQRWLEGAESASQMSKVPLLDLFYWEQRGGRWASGAQTELDIVHETFAPFNHREYIELILAVPQVQRRAPDQAILRNIIAELWPEALSEPINPKSWRKRVYQRAASLGLGGVIVRGKRIVTSLRRR